MNPKDTHSDPGIGDLGYYRKPNAVSGIVYHDSRLLITILLNRHQLITYMYSKILLIRACTLAKNACRKRYVV